MTEFISIKLDVLLVGLAAIEKNEKIINIIMFSRRICNRKTYRQLIKCMTKEICELFGF